MKILLISGSFPDKQCGVGDYTANLATALVKQGIEVFVLTSHHPKISKNKNRYAKIGIKILDEIKRWDFHSLSIIKKFVKTINPDIIHIQYQTGTFDRMCWVNLFPIFLKKFFVVVTFHDTHLPNFPFKIPRFIKNRLLLTPLLFANHIIVSNDRDKNTLLSLWQVIEQKFSEIPIGTSYIFQHSSYTIPENINRLVKVNNGEYLLTCYGFIRDDRNYKMLLQAFKHLIDEGFHIKLLFLGGIVQKQILKEIITLATSLGIEKKIIFTGYLPSYTTLQILKRSYIVILPFKNGVSMANSTLVTVLTYGIPTIATNSENLPSYIIDHQNIILVPPSEHTTLALALKELILSKDLRKKISAGALNISHNFSWNMIASRHIEIYNRIRNLNNLP